MCGCRGSSFRSPAPAAVRPAAAAPRPAPTPPANAVALRYLGQVPLLVKGAVSGRVYALRPAAARLDCDPRDVSTFLASRLFARAET